MVLDKLPTWTCFSRQHVPADLPQSVVSDKALSTFTPVLYLSTNLRHLYFSRLLPLYNYALYIFSYYRYFTNLNIQHI